MPDQQSPMHSAGRTPVWRHVGTQLVGADGEPIPPRKDYMYDAELNATLVPTGRSRDEGGGSYGFDAQFPDFEQNIIAYDGKGHQKLAVVRTSDLARSTAPKAPKDVTRGRPMTQEEAHSLQQRAEQVYTSVAPAAEPDEEQPAQPAPAGASWQSMIPTASGERAHARPAQPLEKASFDMLDEQQPVEDRPEPQQEAAVDGEGVARQSPPEPPPDMSIAPQTLAEQMMAQQSERPLPGYIAPASAPGGAPEYEPPHILEGHDPAQFGNYMAGVPRSTSQPPRAASGGVAGLTRREHTPVTVQIRGPWGTVNQPFSYVFYDGICLVLLTDHRKLAASYELPDLREGSEFMDIEVHVHGETIPCVWAGIKFTMPDNSATFTVLLIRK